MELKNKKVLLVGLGVLGGGVATANFLLAEGARLTITDLRNRKELRESLEKLNPVRSRASNGINFVFGRHRAEDFKKNDLIVFNAGVPFNSPWIKLARRLKKKIANDLEIFLKHQPVKVPYIGITGTPYIAVTGTRGKTTTATWVHHLLPGSVLGGNVTGRSPLEILKKNGRPFVLEISSFQLEFGAPRPAPHIAIITNFSNDHLNRYGTLANYFKIKARVFQNQTAKDFLILNANDIYTKKFLALRPKARVYFFSLRSLPRTQNGIFINAGKIFFRERGRAHPVGRVPNLPEISLVNLLRAALAARLQGMGWKNIFRRARNLPHIPFRQEEILRNQRWTVINDSAATSPDATLAAIKRFSGRLDLILIAGGTDKKLDFRELAKKISQTVPQGRIFLLEGSATAKLSAELRKNGCTPAVFSTLSQITKAVSKLKNGLVIFSPGAASFEKFRNEFDRGEKFNKIAKTSFK